MESNRQSDAQTTYKVVYDKAVKLLSIRMHTKQELLMKLFRYKFDKAVINQVLDRLTELKFVDDVRFAEIFLDNLIRYKTYGYYGIKAKLLQRGIETGLAEKLLAENLSLEQETEIATKLASKKTYETEKLAASLSRKGFRSEVISRILEQQDNPS